MSDVIKLLPDNVINQIAAGEVIQRPASAVKELLENAVDAGSTKIKLIIKDAGKTLIQVIDNGCGMSETDARLSFEKHATSKISHVDDIFAINTKGFRGEALASIAAIATVELKTRLASNNVGTLIEIENGVVKLQEPCQSEVGSSFTVKNLFFSVPARKNFLKSDTVELRHIIEEFQRVVLAHPEVEFTFYNNTTELFHLPKSNLKQRIIGLYNNSYNEKLAPVSEETTILKITGFIGKPEFARKTRGEQFFFVNKRFIKNNYLHHAVSSAYSELISKDAYPSYFIFLEIPPDKIDINIHPTKTEIKFEDEQAIYAILKAAVKKSLGQHNIMPPMDFEQEMSMQINPVKPGTPIKMPQIKINPNYNPFKEETKTEFKPGIQKPSRQSIEAANEALKQIEEMPSIETHFTQHTQNEISWSQNWNEQYIVALKNHHLLLVNQQMAWERVFYEEALSAMAKQKNSPTQKELFPQTLQFSPADFYMINEFLPDLKYIGFDISEFGKQTFIVYGIPTGVESSSVQAMLEEIIENIKQGKDLKKPRTELIAKAYANKQAGRKPKVLKEDERLHLLEQLFSCHIPDVSPEGKKIYMELSADDITHIFKGDQ